MPCAQVKCDMGIRFLTGTYLDVFDSFPASHSVSPDDGSRMNLLLDKFISIAKEFSCNDDNRGRAVAHLFVLKLSKLDQNLEIKIHVSSKTSNSGDPKSGTSTAGI